MTFTQRKNLVDEYNLWAEEHNLDVCTDGTIYCIISFLDHKGFLKYGNYKEVIRYGLSEHLKKRLYETAINNIRVKCDADIVYAEIAERRLDNWINEYLENGRE